MKIVPPKPYDTNSHIMILMEEQIKQSSKGQKSQCSCLQCLLFLVTMFFFSFYLITIDSFEYNPQISIESITSSKIDVSSSPSLPSYYVSLFAHNLTINFIVENRSFREVKYKSVVVSISYEGNILWANTLGLYHQQKEESTSIQVHFSNLPVEIMGGDDVAKKIMSTTTTRSGSGVFAVDINGLCNSKKLKVRCRNMMIHQFSSSFTQEIASRVPKICTKMVDKEEGRRAYN